MKTAAGIFLCENIPCAIPSRGAAADPERPSKTTGSTAGVLHTLLRTSIRAETDMPKNPRPSPQTPAESGPPLSGPAEEPSFAAQAGTVAAVGLAAALIEVDLVPGILIGVGAMLAPKLFGGSLRPLLKNAIRAGYSVRDRAREMMAETSEQFQDIVAEVKAEQNGGNTETTAAPPPPASAPAAQKA